MPSKCCSLPVALLFDSKVGPVRAGVEAPRGALQESWGLAAGVKGGQSLTREWRAGWGEG